jgi:hypothetical protein
VVPEPRLVPVPVPGLVAEPPPHATNATVAPTMKTNDKPRKTLPVMDGLLKSKNN